MKNIRQTQEPLGLSFINARGKTLKETLFYKEPETQAWQISIKSPCPKILHNNYFKMPGFEEDSNISEEEDSNISEMGRVTHSSFSPEQLL